MSKKLAEGIDALVLDVKYGSGAFMKNIDDAIELAETLVGIGENSLIKKTIAYLTNMNQPLGYKIGNWLEVEECVEALQGNGPNDIMQLSNLLSGTMIYLGDKAESIEEGVKLSEEVTSNGKAFQKWIDIVEEQGGDSSVIKDTSLYPKASYEFGLLSKHEGFITSMNSFEIGMASLELGAGRKSIDDIIDPVAGVTLKKKVGDKITKGETILTGYTNKPAMIDTVSELLYGAVEIKSEQPEPERLVTHICDSKGTRAFEL